MKTRHFGTGRALMMVALPSVLFLLASAEELVTTRQIFYRNPMVNAGLEQPFTLQVGQSAQVDSLEIVFSRVVQDSRCPSDVVCVWAGDAAVEILLTRPETERIAVTLHTTLRPNKAMVDGYVLHLVRVDPYPRSSSPITLRDYRVTLMVSKGSPAPDSESADESAEKSVDESAEESIDESAEESAE
jgi:hypothetical protein